MIRRVSVAPRTACAAAALVLALTSSVPASSACLTRERAAKTWPTKELTRDADGCWTYYRKDLKREGVDDQPPPKTMAEPRVTIVPTTRVVPDEPLPDQIWIERWPQVAAVELPARAPAEPEPFITGRLIVIIIVSIAMTLAVIEVLWGDKINPKIMRRSRDGYWT